MAQPAQIGSESIPEVPRSIRKAGPPVAYQPTALKQKNLKRAARGYVLLDGPAKDAEST